MDILLLLQAVLYFCIFVSGFFVCIPVGVNRTNFDGLCILYADVHKTESTDSNCDFPIYFGVFGMIIVGLLAGMCFMFFALKSRTDKNIGRRFWTVPFIPLNCILAVFTLVAACILSVGFKIFCDGVKDLSSVIKSCALLENQTFNGTNTGSFVELSSLSQAGAWIGFLLYVGQSAVGIAQFLRNRRLAQQKARRNTVDI